MKPKRKLRPPAKRKKLVKVRWTNHDLSISEAAKEFHSTPETIRRRLRAAEITHTEGKRYSIYVLHTALVGDLHAQRIRETRARADLLELERRQTEGELVTMNEARGVIRQYLGPMRDILVTAPMALAARVNPADPELARMQLETWSEDNMKRLHDV
jgi:hypothetical protein